MAFKDETLRRTIKIKEYCRNKTTWHTTEGYPTAANALGVHNFRMDHDKEGFISTGRQITSEKSFLFLGDSFVECMFMQPEERFVSVVENILNIKCYNAGMSGASLLSSLFTLLVKGINNVNIHSIFYFVSVIDFHVCTFKEDNFFYNTYHYNSIFNDVDFTKPQEFAPDYEMYSSFLQTFFSICAIFLEPSVVNLH